MKRPTSRRLSQLIRRLVSGDVIPGIRLTTSDPILGRRDLARVIIHSSGASSVNAVESLLSRKGKKDLEAIAGVAERLNLRQPVEDTPSTDLAHR